MGSKTDPAPDPPSLETTFPYGYAATAAIGCSPWSTAVAP
jgi:hypothetical protein